MHHLLHGVLQSMTLSGFKAETDALVNSCPNFRNDTELVTPTCKYRFNGRTRFYAACLKGNRDRVRLLLQCRANAGADWAGNVPLVAAAVQGHVEIVRLLLNAPNVEANAVDAGIQATALIAASRFGHVSVVRLLCGLAFRDRVDVQQMVSPQGFGGRFSALHVACRNNHASIVRILLDAGADVDAVGPRGDDFPCTEETPVLSAVYGGSEEAIHELIRKGCRLEEEWSLLHHACSDKARLPALRTLLSYCTGPSPLIELNDTYGRIEYPAILTAVGCGHVQAVKLLVAVPHIDILCANGDGETTWSLAITDCSDGVGDGSEETKLQILRLLRGAMGAQASPSPDSQPSSTHVRCDWSHFRGKSLVACFRAIARKHLAVVRLMLQVDPFLLNWEAEYPEDPAHTTLLLYAVHKGHLTFAKELASMPGCALNHRPRAYDDTGRDNGFADTALDECCRRAAQGKEGYLDMVKFLCGLPGISICSAAEQLLRGQGGADCGAAGVTPAPELTGAGTLARGDAQQGGRKKRKRGGG